MAKTWLITGCSSGFGKELADAVLARGDRLVATARRPETFDMLADRYGESVRTIALDVTRLVTPLPPFASRKTPSAASTFW